MREMVRAEVWIDGLLQLVSLHTWEELSEGVTECRGIRLRVMRVFEREPPTGAKEQEP